MAQKIYTITVIIKSQSELLKNTNYFNGKKQRQNKRIIFCLSFLVDNDFPEAYASLDPERLSNLLFSDPSLSV